MPESMNDLITLNDFSFPKIKWTSCCEVRGGELL